MLTLSHKSLVGQVVAVRPIANGHVQVPALAIEQTPSGDYKVEYAAGNTEVVSYKQVSAPAPWLKAKWLELKAS